ncbi:hypothetical protein B6U91_00025 [Candidatus Pacearchaeota archaeon ex4484_71]|nr:MAG: hypothetical protein B6U91_00025 [Candidatus Pacearchaeota archaeon ex4484_71]
MSRRYLKILPFNDFLDGEPLTYDVGFKVGEGVFLLPWKNNLFDVLEEGDSRGLGWHDCRVHNPEGEIKVYEDLYVLDTYGAKTMEARALIFHRNPEKGLKNSEERMRYLLKKKPRAHRMWDSTFGSIYTPAFGNFIVSISPTHYIHFNEDNEGLAKKMAGELYAVMGDFVKGRDPYLGVFLRSSPAKN